MNRSAMYATLLASALFLVLPIMEPAKGDRVPIADQSKYENKDQYCNNRFGFCIEFPDSLFTQRTSASNGDGAVFRSHNNEVTMTISGEYNILDRTIKDQMELLLSTLDSPAHEVEDHTTVVSDDHFISWVQQEDRRVYLRSHLQNNHFINIIITINDLSYLRDIDLDNDITLVINT